MKTKDRFLLLLGLTVAIIGLFFWARKKSPLISTRAAYAPKQSLATPSNHAREDANEVVISAHADPAPHRKFADMDGLEWNAVYSELKKQGHAAILQAWLDADRVEHDPMKHQNLPVVLTEAMQQRPPSSEFLKQIKEFITDTANPTLDRGMLIAVLGNVQSKETVAMLLDLARTLPDQVLRDSARGTLSSVGGLGNHEELTPILEQAWADANGDPKMSRSLACAMVGVGTSSSMELLLSAALAPDGRNDAQKQAARYALSAVTILNDHAVPPLAELLSNDSPTNEASNLAARTLARMSGTPASAWALAEWMKSANASAAPLARNYSTHSQNPEVWEAALNPSVPFRNEANREAIRAGLAERKAGIIFEPVPRPGAKE